MTDSLITLTSPQFEALMQEKGLDETTQSILSIASDRLGFSENPLTLENLQDGTHPLLDRLDRYKDLSPEERSVSAEEALTLFTNIQDFGMFDPVELDEETGEPKSDLGSFSPQSKAKAKGAVRAIPEALGAYGGAKLGLGTVSLGLKGLAAATPPIGLPGVVAKGALYLTGGALGMLAGMELASKAEDTVFGEADPVIPTLEGDYRFGETGALLSTMAGAPWKLMTSVPKASTGALEFIDTFSKVARGKFTNVSDEAFQLAAKSAGLSEKGVQKLFEQAQKARTKASTGPMFGAGSQGVNVLGIGKFNPAGYLIDPTKGPLSARIVGGIEGGIGKSFDFARDKTGRFLGMEGLATFGGAYGAKVMQDVAPYSEGGRLVGELAGSFIVPLPAQLLVDKGPEAAKGVFNLLRNWYGKDENVKKGILENKLQKDSANRILLALRRSEEYADTVNAEGGIEITAEEKLSKFIEELGKTTIEDGKTTLTLADIAQQEGLDFAPTLRTIQEELAKASDDLRTATGKGREELQAGATAAIRALTATGDPLALAYAARIQQGVFEQNILDNLEESVTAVSQAAKKVIGREAGELSQRTRFSTALYGSLKNQVRLSKERERRLWSALSDFPLTEFYAKNGRRINLPNSVVLLDRSSKRGGLNYTSKGAKADFNAILGKYKEDFDDFREYFEGGQKGRNPFNAERVWTMRSRLQAKASALRKNGNLSEAEALDDLNDALLRDLTGQRDGVSAAYNTARAYTFARNEVFTRSFFSKIQERTKDRGFRIAPEDLLDELFRGGNNPLSKRIGEIRSGGRFLIDNGAVTEEQYALLGTDGILDAAIRDSLGQIMTRKKIPDPERFGETTEKFVVSKSKLDTWKKQPGTQELFDLFPRLRTDFETAEKAQSTFENMLTDISKKLTPTDARKRGFTEDQINSIYDREAFSLALQYEDPGRAVAKALNSEFPSKSLEALYRMADTADYSKTDFTRTMALQGLKSAIFKNALDTSNNSAGLPNGDVLQRMLFTQLKGVDPSVKLTMSDFLIKKGLATQDEMDNVQEAVKTIRGVQEAFNTGDFENILFKKPSLAKLFYVRIAGATAGGAVQNQLKKQLGLPQLGGGLIAEQTGSELVQRVLLKGPEAQRMKVLTKMFSEPELMAKMLKELKSAEEADKAMTAIEKFVSPLARQVGRRIPIGGIYLRDEEMELPQQQESPTSPEIKTTPEELTSLNIPAQAPTLPVGPAPSPVIQTASASLPQTTPQSGPVNRARYAAMFPNDPASALIRQGIGSMMS